MPQPTKNLLGHKLWLIIAVGYTLIITILFLMPASNLPKLSIWGKIPYFDKWIHSSFHAALAFLWLKYLLPKRNIPVKRIFGLLIFCCLLYGIIIEVVQYSLNDGRNADGWDVLANFTGTLIGVIIFALTTKKLTT